VAHSEIPDDAGAYGVHARDQNKIQGQVFSNPAFSTNPAYLPYYILLNSVSRLKFHVLDWEETHM
jgi:hypothetical protein